MKSSVIGIGIVGAGRAGMIHARNFARLNKTRVVTGTELEDDIVRDAAAAMQLDCEIKSHVPCLRNKRR